MLGACRSWIILLTTTVRCHSIGGYEMAPHNQVSLFVSNLCLSPCHKLPAPALNYQWLKCPLPKCARFRIKKIFRLEHHLCAFYNDSWRVPSVTMMLSAKTCPDRNIIFFIVYINWYIDTMAHLFSISWSRKKWNTLSKVLIATFDRSTRNHGKNTHVFTTSLEK